MPTYKVKANRVVSERRLVREQIEFVIEADNIDEARELVRYLDQEDNTILDELDWDSEDGDILGSDFIESAFGDPTETDQPADLTASEILGTD